MVEEVNYAGPTPGEVNAKVKDIEEKQRILKDRTLLIGQNLIDLKEKNSDQILELKKDVESLKEGMNKMKMFLENISREMSKLARKDDVEILAKQAKMFQPLEYLKENK